MSTAPGWHPPTQNAAHPDSVRDLAARLDSILGGLLLLIAAQFRRLGPLTLPLWIRISRARQRLGRLLARLADGTLPKPGKPRPGRPGGPPAAKLPRGQAWLVAILGYHAAGRSAQLNTLLADPAIAAAIAGAPPHAHVAIARTLRPLCRLLGVDLPAVLQLPKRLRKSRPPRARPAQPRTKPPVIPPWGLPPTEPEPPLPQIGIDTAGLEFDFKPA